MTAPHNTIYRKDYCLPDYICQTISLSFKLYEESTIVHNKMHFSRQENAKENTLILLGKELKLLSIKLNGEDCTDYSLNPEGLTIEAVPEHFDLEIETEIKPQENTSLEGLYKSSGNFCTQCEAEGFRKITYYQDRPDIMAIFSVYIEGDKTKYPVLLSNGNPVDSGDLKDGRHWVKWHDPFPKPSYLFALVAGDLACISDTFTTMSGREIDCRIYVEHHNTDKCDHALLSLKKSMKWDEDVYGLEYDLDIYMIVAVDDFNMGAMENKGLNVFNSKYVLAKPETATDGDYEGIERVIAHEYFHNWSGNRVTCRDWFQLSLKEGFTVFRDQEFGGDMSSRAVKRIEDVNILRAHQFAEDAGPMAHPIRPDSYVEINNFYTVTVYNKGAEVVRMQHLLTGAEGFRKATDLYFERHDNQAVTCEDFVKAVEDANEMDLSQFRNWYSQAGTPVVSVEKQFDEEQGIFKLTLSQDTPDTPGQTDKAPFQIPILMHLQDRNGEVIEVNGEKQCLLNFTKQKESFTFPNLSHEPVISLLNNFSAPVKLKNAYNDDDLLFLMAHAPDPFCRWDAMQTLVVNRILSLCEDFDADSLSIDDKFLDAFKLILEDENIDDAMKATLLVLPNQSYISRFMTVIKPIAIHEVRQFIKVQIAKRYEDCFHNLFLSLQDQSPYEYEANAVGRRSLKAVCLGYLLSLKDDKYLKLCKDLYRDSNNMTDTITALSCLRDYSMEAREEFYQSFYEKWKDELLVLTKWLSLQASSSLEGTLEHVKALKEHEAFNMSNPNKVRALIGAFTSNPKNFHAIDGSGYAFLAENIIELDSLNPQVSSRLVRAFNQWKSYDPERQKLMREAMEKIISKESLSRDVYEIVSKSLKM